MAVIHSNDSLIPFQMVGHEPELSTPFKQLVDAQTGEVVQVILHEFLLRRKDALPFLERKLEAEEPAERWWAIRILAEFNVPWSSRLIGGALSDGDPGVRQCAALALRMNPNPETIPSLALALENSDRLFARLAGDALVAVGDQSVPALLRILKEGVQSARVEAIRALALMDDMSAVPALFASLDDKSAVIEFWANEGLQRHGIGMVFYW